jgi:hypothetical protein
MPNATCLMPNARCRMPRVTAVLAALVLAWPAAAVAQNAAARERVIVSLNGGYQASSQTFDDDFSFEQYLEQATVDVDYEVDAGPAFDGSVMIRLWQGLGAGVGITRFSKDGLARIAGSIPHPFQFGQPRAIEGETSVDHTETGTHIQIGWMGMASRSVRYVVWAGPSWISVEQSFVTGVRYSETYPFDTAEFSFADLERASESATGFNAGVDVTWAFAKNVGVGGLVRFARATATIAPASGRTIDLDVGGFTAGGGVRLLF